MEISVKTIPVAHYPNYRLNVMFDGYKWDLQAGEQSTISDKVAFIERKELSFLVEHSVKLYHETVAMERALQKRPDLVREMGISEKMTNELCQVNYDLKNHVRFMRFDFHPTTEGWQISEVNSDVPAGYPEASILPQLAQVYFDGYSPCGCFGNVLISKLEKLIPSGSLVAYLHDTYTVEDYQILHYLGDLLEKKGYQSMYASPEHIKWADNKASGIGGIVRYYPVEWLEFAKDVDWVNFVHSETTSCNHPVALLTQSKRLPLVWDKLGVDVPTWKKLLPETKCVSAVADDIGWIFKPAFGRVGEGINIPGTVSAQEDKAIQETANKDKDQWVAQKMFTSLPIDKVHLNFGVFVVDGEFAGLFCRASEKLRMDEDASEIPVLVKEEM